MNISNVRINNIYCLVKINFIKKAEAQKLIKIIFVLNAYLFLIQKYNFLSLKYIYLKYSYIQISINKEKSL